MQSPLIGIVEDDEATLDMMEALLAGAGYRTMHCRAGKDAQLRIRETQPNLVILDWWLENRDAGGIVLGSMELDPTTSSIPVIICSAHAPAMRAHAQRLREKGYTILEKPFAIDDLLRLVDEAVRPGSGQDAPEGTRKTGIHS